MKKYILLLIFFLLAVFLLPKSIPILLGLLTAFIFEPIILALQSRWKQNRILYVTLVFIAFIAITGIFGYIILANVVEQLVYFSSNLPSLIAKFNYLTGMYMNQWEIFSAKVPKEVIDAIEVSFISLEESILTGTSKLTQSIILLITTIPETLLEILVYFISLFLFSVELPRLKESVLSFFSEKTRSQFLFISEQLNKAGIGFIKAQFLFSIVTFILCYIGLLVLRVDYPILLSFFIVLVDILPVLGTGSVLVPYAVYCFLSNQQETGVGLILLFLVITVVRRVIEPKVYSSSMGISPLASLISMYLGFQLMGFLGLIIGPSIVILFDTLQKARLLTFQFKI